MKVCCIEAQKIDPAWTRETVALDIMIFDRIHAQDMRWIERPLAENDPSFKQIIPYVITREQGGERLLCYPRHGTEKRLHGLYSCGIGGHIDEEDKRETFEETVKVCTLRELSEELRNFSPELVDLSYKGIIYEAANEVGAVHLGIVYLAQCRAGFEPVPAEEIAGAEWKTRTELALLQKETWTNLAFRIL